MAYNQVNLASLTYNNDCKASGSLSDQDKWEVKWNISFSWTWIYPSDSQNAWVHLKPPPICKLIVPQDILFLVSVEVICLKNEWRTLGDYFLSFGFIFRCYVFLLASFLDLTHVLFEVQQLDLVSKKRFQFPSLIWNVWSLPTTKLPFVPQRIFLLERRAVLPYVLITISLTILGGCVIYSLKTKISGESNKFGWFLLILTWGVRLKIVKISGLKWNHATLEPFHCEMWWSFRASSRDIERQIFGSKPIQFLI